MKIAPSFQKWNSWFYRDEGLCSAQRIQALPIWTIHHTWFLILTSLHTQPAGKNVEESLFGLLRAMRVKNPLYSSFLTLRGDLTSWEVTKNIKRNQAHTQVTEKIGAYSHFGSLGEYGVFDQIVLLSLFSCQKVQKQKKNTANYVL